MFRSIVVAAAVCAMLVLAGADPASASDLTGRFRVGGLLGVATAGHGDLNDTIDDYGDVVGPMVDSWSDDEVGGGPVWGLFGEYVLSEQFVVGVEFSRLSGDGGFGWRVQEYEDEYYVDMREDVDYAASTNAISVYGIYRMPIGSSPVLLRLGAGVGYLLGAKLELDGRSLVEYGDWRALDERQEMYTLRFDVEASGSAVTLHGLVGAEYAVTDRLLLVADASYRVAGIDELEIDSVAARMNGEPIDIDLEEGEILRWFTGEDEAYFSTSEGDPIGLDFGGLEFTLAVAYTF